MGKQISRLRDEDVDLDLTATRKVSLLGCGDTGKSTFLKQTKILDSHYTKEERESFIEIIRGNIVKSIKQLIQLVYELDIPIDRQDRELLAYINNIDNEFLVNINGIWSDELVDDIVTAWETDAVQQAWKDRHKLCGNFAVSIQHFLNKIEQIRSPNWVPTVTDVTLSQVKTTGIVDYEAKIGKTLIQVVDTGGQRNERKKWVHCFDGVHGVVFTVSLPEYATLMYEDESTNRAKESLELFKEVVNSNWFVDRPFILLFTKADLLCYTTTRHRFGDVFVDFTGNDNSCKDIIEYLKDKFIAQYKGTERNKILPIIVNSIDKDLMRDALLTMADVVVRGSTAKYKFKMYHQCRYAYTPLFTKIKMKHTKFCDIEIRTRKESRSDWNQGDYTPRNRQVSRKIHMVPIEPVVHDFDYIYDTLPPVPVQTMVELEEDDEELLALTAEADTTYKRILASLEPIVNKTQEEPRLLEEEPVVKLDLEEIKRQEVKKKSKQELERLVALMEQLKKK